MAGRVTYLGERDGMSEYSDDRGNRFTVPSGLSSHLAEHGGQRSAHIDDRRAQTPVVAPSAPDATLRGMPQNEHEMKLWEQHVADLEAVRQGGLPAPRPQGVLLEPAPQPHDPAGVEAERVQMQQRYGAVNHRAVARDQAMAELSTKWGLQ